MDSKELLLALLAQAGIDPAELTKKATKKASKKAAAKATSPTVTVGTWQKKRVVTVSDGRRTVRHTASTWKMVLAVAERIKAALDE